MHDAAEPGERLLAGHAWHVSEPGALQVLAGQLVHVALPGSDWKVPAGHGRHWLMEVAPSEARKVPAGHATHDVLPYWSWYVPGLQDAQAVCCDVPPSIVPYVPGLHCWHDG